MFFKKKVPVVEFLATVPGIEKTAPILPAKDILPEWWKKMSIKNSIDVNKSESLFVKLLGENRSIKKCPAIKDFLTNGWVLTMWCDLVVKIVENSIVCEFSLPGWTADTHPKYQMIDHLPSQVKEKYLCVFKPGCPWLIRTTTGYSTIHLNPFYFFNSAFDSAEGIQDSDIYHDMGPQLLIKKNEVYIPKGTPLQIIIPFKRENIQCNIIPYNNKTAEIMSYNNLVAKSKFSSAASYNEQKRKNNICPFS